MAQQPVEVILAKQFASHLAMPIFLVDPSGDLLFYNESAERILGHRFEETGAMPVDEWSTIFSAHDDEGRPLPPEQLPLVVALEQRRPAHRRIAIQGFDGVRRTIAITALPLEGGMGRFVGAMAFFWEIGAPWT